MVNSERKEDILNRDDTGISLAKNFPARMMRIIFGSLCIKGSDFVKLMTNYVIDPANNIDPANRLVVKGNLARALLADRMSWDKLEQGFRVVEADTAEVIVVLRRAGDRSIYKSSIRLGKPVEKLLVPTRFGRIDSTSTTDELLGDELVSIEGNRIEPIISQAELRTIVLDT